ncbi:hypothetical protein EXIGLDRAFT_337403 [Exidia glandulosa HHB12029]|uniref:Uncharacterized protein n=1 Tax=Exidia glandulosa HHB12029 TaxID=1314781 RepID=A0A165LIW1_EXIGL|nr:hypothetical protein EXIGLDRAFT_337403 [Exidia glandulosa HHB12029]
MRSRRRRKILSSRAAQTQTVRAVLLEVFPSLGRAQYPARRARLCCIRWAMLSSTDRATGDARPGSHCSSKGCLSTCACEIESRVQLFAFDPPVCTDPHRTAP